MIITTGTPAITPPAQKPPSAPPQALTIWWVPLAAGVLALLTIHLSYLVAATLGHVPWCLPWIDSCTSISATGRQWPERMFFKPLMTLAVLLLAMVFWLAAHWLAARGDPSARARRALIFFALLAVLCIVTYTAALGEAGSAAKLLRKIGVTLGFGAIYLGEILLFARLTALRRGTATGTGVPVMCITPRHHRALFVILATTLTLGVISVLLSAFYADYPRIDDAFEWLFALLLNLYLIVLALVWRQQQLRLVLHTEPA